MSVKAGMYKGRAMAGSEQWTRVQSSGNLQLVLGLQIWEEGSDGGETMEVQSFLTFTEKSERFCFDRLKACGWPGGEFPVRTLPGIDKNEVSVLVKYETYQGKERMKVDIMTGGTFKVKEEDKLSDADLRRFQAMFKSSAPRASTSSTTPARTPDKDLPF